MELFIVRHAWAGDRDDARWPDDGQRPLTEAGRARFRDCARALRRRGFRPEVIATSPLVRCMETARIAAEAVGEKVRVVTLDELLPGGDLDGLIAWTARLPKNVAQAAWVGHAPDVNRLCGELLGVAASNLRFSKGAAASLLFEGPIARGEGQLRWMVTAKILGC